MPDDLTFTLKPTGDGYTMTVETAGGPLFKTDDGLSHRVTLTGPKGGMLASAYGAALTAMNFYKPERDDAR